MSSLIDKKEDLLYETSSRKSGRGGSIRQDILFDLDGTLLDSKHTLINAAYVTAKRLNLHEMTYQEIEKHFETGFADYLSRMTKREKDFFPYFLKEKNLFII